ncbi:hypothetical protein J2X36_003684 [Methylobacterium sp. BE186]|uniref:DUF3617 domain-containing protein n=1 Tax=Methylobacterium sp. BE186 TaxID=2817715 RepID=UPI002858B074|nr:DUF3617 family protein [Methylobacterium sp. BE186]MDR7038912.1 hypothetical protein [Methylobacterium sp. BE186]
MSSRKPILPSLCLVPLLVPLLVVCAAATGSGMPEAGRYRTEIRLELPHLDGAGARKTVDLCVTEEAGTTGGLKVLSDNNPLASCPISNMIRDGASLSFVIACEGRNAAWGHAAYTLSPTGFEGRIAMRMGGKNMTMTEVQSGHRTGSCAAPAPAP